MIVIKNGTVLTLGEENRVLHNHDVWIEGDRISKIVPTSATASEGATIINGRGKVIMPGMINAHMHFYSTFARGLTKAKTSTSFVEVLENFWWRLDRKLTIEDVHMSALIPLIDAIRKGTTTLIDHHASPFSASGSLDAIADAVTATGLRASLCYELSDRDGREVADHGIEENVRFIKRCQSENDPRLRALFGLHASFTISDKTLQRASELARALGAGFHVHTAEALSDQEHSLLHFGSRVVDRFHRFGILGPKTICAHGVHVTSTELRLLSETGTALVHNPQSNMNNAVGIANILEALRAGVLVGLGTDAMTVNMFEEMRTAVWAQKLREQHPNAAFVEMVGTLAFNNAKIADRYWPGMELGRIKEGGMADIILVDYLSPTPLDSSNALGHLCFGLAESQVDTTIVAGKVLMRNKELQIGIDEEQICAQARKLATRLWERF